MATTAHTAQEVFATSVHDLSAPERLRLASMILQDLTHVVDQADAWSEQDQRDLTAFSLQHAGQLYPEDEDLV